MGSPCTFARNATETPRKGYMRMQRRQKNSIKSDRQLLRRNMDAKSSGKSSTGFISKRQREREKRNRPREERDLCFSMMFRPSGLMGKEIEFRAPVQCWECEEVDREEPCWSLNTRKECGRRKYRLKVTEITYGKSGYRPFCIINGRYRFFKDDAIKIRICKKR